MQQEAHLRVPYYSPSNGDALPLAATELDAASASHHGVIALQAMGKKYGRLSLVWTDGDLLGIATLLRMCTISPMPQDGLPCKRSKVVSDCTALYASRSQACSCQQWSCPRPAQYASKAQGLRRLVSSAARSCWAGTHLRHGHDELVCICCLCSRHHLLSCCVLSAVSDVVFNGAVEQQALLAHETHLEHKAGSTRCFSAAAM